MAVAKNIPEECPRCREQIQTMATMTTAGVNRTTGMVTRAQPRWLCSECGHQWEVDPDLAQLWLAGLFDGPRSVAPKRHVRRAGAR